MRLLSFLSLLAVAACVADAPPATPPPGSSEAAAPLPVAAPVGGPSPARDDSSSAALAAARERAARIEGALGDLRAVEGTWVRGDASSTFTAYFDGATLVHLRETMDAGEYGDSDYSFFLDADSLFHYRESSRRVAQEPERAGAVDTILVALALAPDGGVRGSEKFVNGTLKPVRPHEAPNARRHAAALRAQLPSAAPGR